MPRGVLAQQNQKAPADSDPEKAIAAYEPFKLERALHRRGASGSVTPGQLAILPPDART